MNLRQLHAVFKALFRHRERSQPASVTEISQSHPDDAYRVLISCIISLRTKDEVTHAASLRLFSRADTPAAMLSVPEEEIAALIYPAGFYRTKAATIHLVSREILERFSGRTPDEIEDLLTLKGVGRKTANLVVTLGYGKPGICVDTHVHRIANRWGLVETKTPDQTEMALREILPRQYWIPINDLLVCYGREICKPVSPFCSECDIKRMCPQIGVASRR